MNFAMIMKKTLILVVAFLAFALSAVAERSGWSQLIGKTLVLYRYGMMQGRWFEKSNYPNPAGKAPMEQMVLVDSTHLSWKYSGQGNFEIKCSIQDTVLNLEQPLFGNYQLRIISREDEVVLVGAKDVTRAFFIHDANPSLSVLPASCNSEKGFCNGVIDDLIPSITDLTYHSKTPMGRHFLYYKPLGDEQKKWFETAQEEFFNKGPEEETMKSFDINLYPHGKPVLADVNQKSLNDCNAVSVLANMAFLYPDFIRSIIHQESPDSFRVDMFDPEGNPIVVCVNNKFPVNKNGYPVFCVGKDNQPNWISILEKAAMKWVYAYQHMNWGSCTGLNGCNSEMITPLFTGDGRSFSIQPGRLSGEELARIINTCLEHGMMVNGGFLEADIPLDAHKTVSKHGHTFLPPQRPGALYAIRNPWGHGKDNHIMNVMNTDSIVFPLIDIRIISPGKAAKYFHRNMDSNQ